MVFRWAITIRTEFKKLGEYELELRKRQKDTYLLARTTSPNVTIVLFMEAASDDLFVVSDFATSDLEKGDNLTKEMFSKQDS